MKRHEINAARKEMDFSLIDQAKVFRFGPLRLTDRPARSAIWAAVACWPTPWAACGFEGQR